LTDTNQYEMLPTTFSADARYLTCQNPLSGFRDEAFRQPDSTFPLYLHRMHFVQRVQ